MYNCIVSITAGWDGNIVTFVMFKYIILMFIKKTKYLIKENSKTAGLAAHYVSSLHTVAPDSILVDKNL